MIGPDSVLRLKLRELFGIDMRTLALVRVSAALLVLGDLAWRAQHLSSFYTDAGVVPRTAVTEDPRYLWNISLHFVSGLAIGQALLFALTAAVAMLLLVGYRTRLTTFLTWLLLVSLHVRNPIVLTAADRLLGLLLFWGMFVPWNARYSIDCALSHAKPNDVHGERNVWLSIGTAAMLIQMPLVYLFTALHKNQPEWRTDFTAVYYTLMAENYARPLGLWLAETLPLSALKFLTIATLLAEFALPFILFLPFFTAAIRLLATIALLFLQVGFGLCLDLGLFPWISVVALLPFLPSPLWDNLAARLRTPERTNLRIYFDGECDFCRKSVLLLRTFLLLPEASLLPAQDDPDILADMKRLNSWVVVAHTGERRYKFDALIYVFGLSPLTRMATPIMRLASIRNFGMRLYEHVAANRNFWGRFTAFLTPRPLRLRLPLLASLLCAFSLFYVVLSNFGSIRALTIPPRLKTFGQVLRLDQHWVMFAAAPKSFSWAVAAGRLRDGREVDVIVGDAPPNWRKPDSLRATFGSYRWRRYWTTLAVESYKGYRQYAARSLCRKWNGAHTDGEVMEELTIYNVEHVITTDKTEVVPMKKAIWTQNCSE